MNVCMYVCMYMYVYGYIYISSKGCLEFAWIIGSYKSEHSEDQREREKTSGN